MSVFNRVIRTDRRNRVALFEAAVQFPELQRKLAEIGLQAHLPLCPRPGKSALAAYLEREPTIYPRFQWDLSDPLLCVEVVFGTGELFRTGSAAGPGTIEEQWAAGDAQKNPMGPGQSDLMRVIQGAQGSIGIVTWCSAKAELLPSDETLYVAGAEQLSSVVRVAYGMFRRNHPNIFFIVDRNALAALLARDRAQVEASRSCLPRWNIVYSLAAPLYYPEMKLRYVRREIDVLLREHSVEPISRLPALDHDRFLEMLTRPDLTGELPYWKHAGLRATRELFFHTTMDRADRFLETIYASMAQHGWDGDVLTYIQPQTGGRCCHLEVIFPHQGGEERAARCNEMVIDLARTVRYLGAFFSRPYGPITPIAFENTSTAWMIPKVKRLFDPDGILSPGCLEVPSSLPMEGETYALQ